jgi:photoactive yellow protein
MDTPTSFESATLPAWLGLASAADLDALDFGVIRFDGECLVDRYNVFESRAAGLAPERVLGLHLFDLVAPCMNNAMVAQRFEGARQERVPMDLTIDYVLTLRMRPTKVKLRLLADPGSDTRYVLIQRRTG